MRKHVLTYELLCGALIAVLKAFQYRWLVVEYSEEIYGGLVAAVFASVGIWLGLKLTRHTVRGLRRARCGSSAARDGSAIPAAREVAS